MSIWKRDKNQEYGSAGISLAYSPVGTGANQTQYRGIKTQVSDAAWQTPHPRRKPQEITSGELGQRLRDLMEKEYAKPEIEKRMGINIAEQKQVAEIPNSTASNETEIRKGAQLGPSILKETADCQTEESSSALRLKAELEANRLLKDAREQVDKIIIKAQTEAEERAREKAAGILWQAKQKANEIQAEAVRKAMQSIVQVREDIDKYLAQKIEETRQQINDCMAAQPGRVVAEVRTSD
ncbi:MAG: hypothetical protein PHV74_09780 [Dehalococcoidia bacterium]|nr:hypothetical protein [Dehalococcoidia bacterium]